MRKTLPRFAFALSIVVLTCGATVMRLPHPGLKNWMTSYSRTLGSNSSVNTGKSYRIVVPASDISVSGTQIRVTFTAGTGEGFHVNNASIVGRDGSTDDGTAVPTELLFSTASGFSIAAGATITSDALSYALDETLDYLVIIDFAADTDNDNCGYDGTSATDSYFKLATASYDQQTVTGFTAGNYINGVSKIEVK